MSLQISLDQSDKEFSASSVLMSLRFDKFAARFMTGIQISIPKIILSFDRPCAMVVPEFELICEIMLVAEGFVDARLLARKFITLYTLCKELLSKQVHVNF